MNYEYLRHTLRAKIYLLVKKPELALVEFRQALHHKPESQSALNSLAYLTAHLKHYAEAEALFRQALIRRPNDPYLQFDLAFVCEQLGKTDEAISHFRKAVDTKPALDRAWYGMGLAYARQGRHEEAVAALERAAELQPMNPYAWYNLGMAYHAVSKPGKVKEVVLHMHRFDPKMARKLIIEAGRTDLTHLIGT